MEMMLRCVTVCLLLGVISSAPVHLSLSEQPSSDNDPQSTSAPYEDPQPPIVSPVVGGASQKAPPSLIMEVKDGKTNLSLSFAIFILPEVEEGSGMDRGGRSEDRSDDVSSEEHLSQNIRPITALLRSGMMKDQPVLKFPGDELNNTSNRNQRQTFSDSRQPGTFGANGVSSSSGSISKDLRFGPKVSEVFGSIHEVMDLLSGDQRGFGGSLEKVRSVSPNSGNKDLTSSDPTGTLTFDSTNPGLDIKEVQYTYKMKIPKQTKSKIHNQDSLRFLGVSLTSDSSEESSPGLASPGPGLSSLKDSSSSEEVQSSSVPSAQTLTESDSSESEDQTLAPDLGSDVQNLGRGPGNDSQSAERLPDPDLEFSPGSETNFSSTFEINTNESDESQTPQTPKDATGGGNSASIASSSEFSMGLDQVDLSSIQRDTDPIATYTTSPPGTSVSSGASPDAIIDADHDLSDEEEDASKETDATDLAVNIEPTPLTGFITHSPYPTVSTDANASIEEEQIDSNVHSEANSLGHNQLASGGENIVSRPRPPGRKKPYLFGSLGPINYSHNNQPVATETVPEVQIASLVTNTRRRYKVLQQRRKKQYVRPGPRYFFHSRKLTRKVPKFRLAKVANSDESSSEETK